MNPETVALIDRTYQDLVDDILTAIVGGVVNEPIVFDVKELQYALAEPAADIRGIAGTKASAPRTFLKGIDFVFDEGANAVAWQEGGARPDDETKFYVDYFRRNSRSPLTDINVGSVTRTLGEAIGREILTVYQEINQAYRSAFIDTAEGSSLDFVVAILGITRKTKDAAVGLVMFFRDPAVGVQGAISIPEGTSVRTKKGVVFETTEPRTLQRGQVRIDVPVRASAAFKGEAGKVGAGEIVELAQPREGIATITNLEPTVLGAEDESDEDLRLRAKAALRALGKATVAALKKAVFDQRGDVLEVWDPSGPVGNRTEPGTATLLVESEPERFELLRFAVEETRAAGVSVALAARYVYFTPRVVVRVAAGLSAAGKAKVAGEVVQAIQTYVNSLGSGDPARGKDLLGAVGQVQDVSDPKVVDVMAFRTDVAQPATEGLVQALAEAVTPAPADEEATRAALARVLAAEVPPIPVARVPDRGLVQGPSGARATDTEVEGGDFQVVVPTDGQWWVVLDMGPDDVMLDTPAGP